jgi:hypothetical protein
MEARLMLFTQRGLADTEADQLADKLLQFDREQSGQVTCHLCQHFDPKPKRCGNFRAAGVGAQLGSDLAGMMQRCTGYKAAHITPLVRYGQGSRGREKV